LSGFKNQEILAAWEQFSESNYHYNAHILITMLLKPDATEDIGRWSIEKRDKALFNLRKKIFGSLFLNMCTCPSCGSALEWSFDLDRLNIDTSMDAEHESTGYLVSGDYKLNYRLPMVSDLREKDPGRMLQNCIHNASFKNAAVPIETIGDDTMAQLRMEIEKHCPVSGISFEFKCGACKHAWEEPFDIASYFSKEINNWAKTILREVSVIASAFSWPEDTIVNMGQKKRNYYLSLIEVL
jgi:hypothetical protein